MTRPLFSADPATGTVPAQGAYTGLGVAAVALAAAVPISVALANALLVFLVLAWLRTGGGWASAKKLAAHRVGRPALVLLALLVVGAFYGEGSIAQRWNLLGKYLDLLLLAPLLEAFGAPAVRRRGALAFLSAMAVTLVLSWAIALGILPSATPFKATAGDASVFKDHITQNLLMAFAAFAFAVYSLRTRGWMRAGLLLLAAAAVLDILFLVQGRTGYVILALLAISLLACRLRARGVLAGVVLAGALFGLAYMASPPFHTRVAQAVEQVLHWRPDRAHATPVGLRLDYYENSIRIIAERPLFGFGTGGFVSAYAHEAASHHMEATNNPHDQFLLVAIETGAPGLIALVALFVAQWRAAGALRDPDRELARALVITLVVGCLLNSLLIDYTERLFYIVATALLFGRNPEPAA